MLYLTLLSWLDSRQEEKDNKEGPGYAKAIAEAKGDDDDK